MKIKADQLDRLADLLLSRYRANQLVETRVSDSEIKKEICNIIARNFAEEENIEQEARQVLADFGRATKDMDPYKMFLLAKQKLAAKKGFIL